MTTDLWMLSIKLVWMKKQAGLVKEEKESWKCVDPGRGKLEDLKVYLILATHFTSPSSFMLEPWCNSYVHLESFVLYLATKLGFEGDDESLESGRVHSIDMYGKLDSPRILSGPIRDLGL